MGVMRHGLAILLTAAAAFGQTPEQQRPPADPDTMRGVRFDPATGWPIVPGEATPPPAPIGESRAKPAAAEAAPRARVPESAAEAAPAAARVEPAPAGSLQLDSPLMDVFRATRGPGAFRELGGVAVTWRMTVHGLHGEAIGTREIKHVADCAHLERDRVEHEDGRVFGRIGAQVFAERQGLPRPTFVDAAQDELMLFGLQLRWPWCFGDTVAFQVVGHDVVERSGERFQRLTIERRPPPAFEVFGPEQDPKPRDRFELWCDPGSGLVRELVHRFASSMQARRVLLEDWRDVEGVRMPYRRIYVDEAMHRTTTVEILRIQARRVTERDFRSS